MRAEPLVLAEADDLPDDGVMVGTYFHYNDIRRRWPERLDEIRFLRSRRTHRSPRACRRPARGSGRGGCSCASWTSRSAVNIAADLKALFPGDEYLIEPRVLAAPGQFPRTRAGDVALVSPRVWGAMSTPQRQRVVQIRYRLRPHELEQLGLSLSWDPAGREAVA